VLQCGAVCCSGSCLKEGISTLGSGVLQCVAVCCSVLHCVALCCSVWQFVSVGLASTRACLRWAQVFPVCCSVLQSAAECCSVLQSVPVGFALNRACLHSAQVRSVLQCDAASCSVFIFNINSYLISQMSTRLVSRLSLNVPHICNFSVLATHQRRG
jgi:hypothetical protein